MPRGKKNGKIRGKTRMGTLEIERKGRLKRVLELTHRVPGQDLVHRIEIKMGKGKYEANIHNLIAKDETVLFVKKEFRKRWYNPPSKGIKEDLIKSTTAIIEKLDDKKFTEKLKKWVIDPDKLKKVLEEEKMVLGKLVTN